MWVNTFEESVGKSSELAAKAGCANLSSVAELSCMRSVKPIPLLKTQAGLDTKAPQYWPGPTADGFEYAPTANQSSVLASGDFEPKPVLVGTVRNESSLFECYQPYLPNNAAQFSAQLSHDLRVPENSTSIRKLVELYDASLYNNNWHHAYVDVQTDWQFLCASHLVLDAMARAGLPSYAYRLDHNARLFKPFLCLGVPHATDLLFLFGNVDQISTSATKQLGARMRYYWTKFASGHNPTPSDHPAPAGTPAGGWPMYDTLKKYLRLNAPSDIIGAEWKLEQCKALRPFLR
jgi:carboxylesterase type B